MITDFNITDLVFKNLPKDKRVVLVSHGDVYQFDSNFYINGIFKEEDFNNYHMCLLPLKVISAYPLGMIFENQKIVDINKISRIYDATIFLEKKKYEPIKGKDIEPLHQHLKKIPDKIGKYKHQNIIIQNQNHLVVKDFNNIDIIFPHYEIGRWFYFKSSSMTRQVLSCYLEGLYKSYEYLDAKKENAKITLKYGSNNADVSEIFRFAADEFANIMFHNISVDLSSNMKYLKGNKEVNRKMKLVVNFPIYGDVKFKLRGFFLDKHSFYVYQIIEEDSLYPFTVLNAYREAKQKNSTDIPYAKIEKTIPPLNQSSTDVFNTIPNLKNEIIEVEKENFLLEELRKDLEDKKVKFSTLIDDDTAEIDIEKEFTVSGTDVSLSLNNNQINGDSDTSKLNISNVLKKAKIEVLRESTKLDLFRKMVINCASEYEGFSYAFSDELLIPLKPKEDKSRSQYKKARLADEVTRRKYLFANVFYKNCNYVIVEIEKDKLLDKLSTLIVYKNDYSQIASNIIQDIVKAFVKDNGNWFKNYSNSSLCDLYLNHPDFTNKEGLKNWHSRLHEKLSL